VGLQAVAEAKLSTVVDMISFNSISEFNNYLDGEINKLKSQLGEYLRRLEAVKAKAETLVRFESLLAELAKAAKSEGKGLGLEEREFTLGTTKIVVNPSPKQELEALVAIVRSLQERIMLLEKIKKNLEQLAKIQDIEIKLDVLFENTIPVKIFIKMS
jgi:hypothetical protein